MATYSMKAPDGNTYTILGPEGASDEQVKAEIIKQYPSLAAPAQMAAAPEQPKSMLQNAAHLLGKTLNTVGVVAPFANPVPAIAGAGEMALSGASGFLNQMLKGANATAEGLKAPQGQTASAMRSGAANVPDFTYMPRTPIASGISNGISSALNAYQQKLAGKTADGTIPDWLGASLSAAPDAAMTILGAKTPTAKQAAPWAERFANRRMREIVAGEGKTARPELINEVTDALINAPRYVEGSEPTAGQILSGTAAGSPISALEKQIASKDRGISADFGKRLESQQSARDAADAQLAKPDDPAMQFLKNAYEGGNTPKPVPSQNYPLNSVGGSYSTGVPVKAIVSHIEEQLNKPGNRAVDVLKNAGSDLLDKIKSLSDKNGYIDMRDLHKIRMDLGKYIQGYVEKGGAPDKAVTAMVDKSVQGIIDDSIVKAGGTDWPAFLNEFSSRKSAITADADRAARQPIQPTNLGTEVNPSALGNVIPPMINSAATVTNFLTRAMEKGQGYKVNRSIADALLNPDDLARRLNARDPSAMEVALRSYMAQRALKGAAIGAATQTNQEQ